MAVPPPGATEPAAPPVWCVLVAAGSGSRFGGAKQFATLGGRTVLERAVSVAADCCDGVVVVAHPESVDTARELVDVSVPGGCRVVPGGNTRSGSSRLGVEAVPDSAEVILVHDAARPLATAEVYGRVIDAVRNGADGAVPVVPVVDTIRDTDGELVDRDRLLAVQTPQGFDLRTLRAAHSSFEGDATDDASMVEAIGAPIAIVEGDPMNLKVTYPEDLLLIEALRSRHHE